MKYFGIAESLSTKIGCLLFFAVIQLSQSFHENGVVELISAYATQSPVCRGDQCCDTRSHGHFIAIASIIPDCVHSSTPMPFTSSTRFPSSSSSIVPVTSSSTERQRNVSSTLLPETSSGAPETSSGAPEPTTTSPKIPPSTPTATPTNTPTATPTIVPTSTFSSTPPKSSSVSSAVSTGSTGFTSELPSSMSTSPSLIRTTTDILPCEPCCDTRTHGQFIVVAQIVRDTQTCNA